MVERTKTNWNDDRLDHFAAQVDKRFEQVDKRFDALQQAVIITLAGFFAAFAALIASIHL